jgi:3-oxoacyl-[acyl-carrier protein] reductase
MSYVPFASQVAIVTGGSKGLGRSIALKLASLGANVGIVYNSSAESAHEVRAFIETFL